MNEDKKDEVVQLYLDDIIPNRFQPREVFDEKALKELAVSIKEHGVIQPIIVRSVNGKYEIIAGERRYKASALAGLTKIPAIIRDLDDKESSKVALLENLQRKNLNPIEEARTYQKILELDEMTQEELAKTMGKSQSSVANKIRLLSLSDEIQDAILKEQISERHARALLNVPDSNVQQELLNKIIETKMSVRALEDEIRERYPKEIEVAASEIPVEIDAIASADGFLNSSPLTPTTTEVQEELSNYGKVTIVPPTINEPTATTPIVEEKPAEEVKLTFAMPTPPEEPTKETEPPKIDEKLITPVGAALDNLLNINNPAPAKQTKSTDSVPIINTGFSIPTEDKEGEYFNEIPAISLADSETTVIQPESNQREETPTGLVENSSGSQYSIDEATKQIKDVIEDLKSKGIMITADEMNFPKSYQIIIKIDKPQ